MPPTRRLTVVYNPMKVEDLDEDRRVVAEACRRHGWEEPGWIETTAQETGEKQGREAVESGADVVATLGGDGTVRAVCWGAAVRSRELLTQPLIDAVATLSIDHWNGQPRLDVELKDFRLSEERNI